MEYLEVLDEKGNKTGERKERSEVHKKGIWHKGIHLWLINSKGEILLQKRSPSKEKHPNMWHISCAGHVISGDDSLTTCIKELKEELGVDVKEEQLELLFTTSKMSYPKPGHIEKEFQDIFLVELDIEIGQITLDKKETSAVKYISPKGLRELVKQENSTLKMPPYINQLIDIVEQRQSIKDE